MFAAEGERTANRDKDTNWNDGQPKRDKSRRIVRCTARIARNLARNMWCDAEVCSSIENTTNRNRESEVSESGRTDTTADCDREHQIGDSRQAIAERED